MGDKRSDAGLPAPRSEPPAASANAGSSLNFESLRAMYGGGSSTALGGSSGGKLGSNGGNGGGGSSAIDSDAEFRRLQAKYSGGGSTR